MFEDLNCYEHALDVMLKKTDQASSLYDQITALKIRLQENAFQQVTYGKTETLSHERVRILTSLDKISRQITGKNLDELDTEDGQNRWSYIEPAKKPESEPGLRESFSSTQRGSIQDLLSYLLNLHLWAYYVFVVFLAILSFVANIGSAVGMTLCAQLRTLAALTFIGGAVMLGFSFLHQLKARYQNWDRIVTACLCLIVTTVLGSLASTTCTALPSSPADYQVRVQNLQGQVISNAKVTLELEGGDTPRYEFTDASGIARFSAARDDAGKHGRLIIDAKGYERYILNIDFIPNTLPTVIQLESPTTLTLPRPSIC